MSIPDYQSLMLPLLQLTHDGKEYSLKEAVQILSEQFGLSEEERTEVLPSGQGLLFSNRVGWARTYLKKAGLLASPGRGVIAITPRGLALLKTTPSRIDNRLLRQ